MAELSKAQQKVMDIAKKEIDGARACNDIREWCTHYDESEIKDFYDERFEETKDGIVFANCNYKSLEILQAAGLIEIIAFDHPKFFRVLHKVKVLNY